MALEAYNYVNNNPHTIVVYLGSNLTLEFIDKLYAKGAISVCIEHIRTLKSMGDFIEELVVVSEHKSKRAILAEILKAVPDEIVEVEKNRFSVKWQLTNLEINDDNLEL